MDDVGMVLANGSAAGGGKVSGSAVMRGARPGAEVVFKKMRARDPGPLFSLEPHVCRHCFGRLLSVDAAAGDGSRRYFCSNCGAASAGAAPDVLCACGIRLKLRGPGGGDDAGVRCGPNPSPTPDMPSQIVAIAGESPRPNDSKSVR
jgi:hypothetical protein